MSLRIESLPRSLPESRPQRAPQTSPDTTTIAQAVEDTFDLSDSGRDLHQHLQSLAPADREAYLKMLARLLKSGVVGTETLEVRGRSYQTFATTRLADPRLARARPYR